MEELPPGRSFRFGWDEPEKSEAVQLEVDGQQFTFSFKKFKKHRPIRTRRGSQLVVECAAAGPTRVLSLADYVGHIEDPLSGVGSSDSMASSLSASQAGEEEELLVEVVLDLPQLGISVVQGVELLYWSVHGLSLEYSRSTADQKWEGKSFSHFLSWLGGARAGDLACWGWVG